MFVVGIKSYKVRFLMALTWVEKNIGVKLDISKMPSEGEVAPATENG